MSYATYEEQMLTEALEGHDGGCCTEEAPCLLRVGVTKTLANHKLTPDFRVKEERRKVNPTEAQAKFWTSLMGQLRDLGHAAKAEALEDAWNSVQDFRDYSEMLSGGKKMIERYRSEDRAKQTKMVEEGLTEGMYLTEGHVYKVKRSQAGHLYAMLLTDEGFVFQQGAIRRIKPGHRMSLEDAKIYGRQTGTCCVCGRELTNETSVKEGIGPVCGGRF